MHYAPLKCKPWVSGGQPILFRGKFQVDYKLQDG
jgi:hypothetical protein